MQQNSRQVNKPVKVIISGGGTGGHVYPAIAIADAIKKQQPDAEILFIGALGRMEMQKVPEAGYNIIGLEISGFQRSFSVQNLIFPIKVLKSLINSWRVLQSFKPNVAIGVGGYASGPLLFVASILGIPTLIQEQNGYAGVTNRILSRKARKICVAYPNMDKFFPASKLVFTGNPVRANINSKPELMAEGLEYFGLNPAMPVLLVIGGSLGARTINQTMADSLEKFTNAGIQLIWQTGKSGFEAAITATMGNTLPNVKVFDFIGRMDLAYNTASLVVSRAGALSISELCLVGKPVILVPSPNVAEDHQTKNAMALVEKDAAILVTDANAKIELADKVISLIRNPAHLFSLSTAIAQLGSQQAADKIAQEALQLI